ncbi:kelch motif family protein, putative [Ichthyophthirius multifiliis]|uniref:Kelch motif family protein, putative n=1 Tax=Ichthyophthirius multifiliis TaxID=5932 RepID=G0QZD8_ICHMU|nr:kelch motif family protein, putative [Ichthyophthirius multifiliis]EGR29407.1 kelch motif family protein, putative [Ichthyophthirius multifiliis]|eukprot:XP_004030643.1 kelch motif family protein, putative [Ichthyophthirius multifiliis]
MIGKKKYKVKIQKYNKLIKYIYIYIYIYINYYIYIYIFIYFYQLNKVYEGPRNYLWRRNAFHFYDPHNKFIYCINDSNNIFEKGIRYSYFDTSLQNGDFKEGNLRFACSTEEIYESFINLTMQIQQVNYCTEIQHGVFLMHASKNIYTLDFNYKCFYSFSSLKQLQNYKLNNTNHPRQYQYTYKILNQPFEIKFYNQYNFGSNVTFQQGLLHILGRKEIETVLCSYELFPQQGTMVLRKCKSLHFFEDLLQRIPKDIQDIVTYQQKIKTNNIKNQKNILYEQQSQINKSQKDTKDIKEQNIQKKNTSKNNIYSMRKIKIQSLSDFQNFVILLEQTIQTKHLIGIKQCYLEQEEISTSSVQYYVVLIEEYCKMSLMDEILQRQNQQKPFKSKHIAYILKAVFKTILCLQDISILHGNIVPKFVYYTNRDEIKIAGWYLENRSEFQNDLYDACTLIYQTATLNFDENSDFALTNDILQLNRNKLDEYPGLFQFLNNCLISAQHQQEQIDVDQLSIQIKEVYQSLQVKELKDLKNGLISLNKRIFWIGYNSNYIITNFYDDIGFCKTEVIQQNHIPYKFSKYNMFAFDGETTMYISGAQKEEFKYQTFYSLEFTYVNQSTSRLRKLKDIPFACLSPTLLWLNGWVYCIGGYEIQFDGSKHINKKAFRYSIKENDWEQLADIPIGIVNSTALQSQNGQSIYLLGGISDDVELRRKELNVIIYNVEYDEWSLNVDLSIKSPFVNNRFIKPVVDQIGFNIFLTVQRSSDKIIIRFFELEKGGINLKFIIDDERDKLLKDQIKDQDVFNEYKGLEYYQAFQDELSMIFIKDTMYFFDELTKNLVKVIFDNYINVRIEKQPCGIIGKEKIEHDQVSYNENQSNESFYFNGDYFS